jgi:hypothetical protein
MDWQDRLAEALRRYHDAAEEEAAAWGPQGTDGRHALPQAVQLGARLDVALAGDQRDPEVRRAVAVLRKHLARAQADPEDRRRCERWQAAYDRYLGALSEVETVSRYATP